MHKLTLKKTRRAGSAPSELQLTLNKHWSAPAENKCWYRLNVLQLWNKLAGLYFLCRPRPSCVLTHSLCLLWHYSYVLLVRVMFLNGDGLQGSGCKGGKLHLHPSSDDQINSYLCAWNHSCLIKSWVIACVFCHCRSFTGFGVKFSNCVQPVSPFAQATNLISFPTFSPAIFPLTHKDLYLNMQRAVLKIHICQEKREY